MLLHRLAESTALRTSLEAGNELQGFMKLLHIDRHFVLPSDDDTEEDDLPSDIHEQILRMHG